MAGLSLDALLASGTTALGLSLVFLWLLITERIVPKGRLDEVKAQMAEAKESLKDALAVIKAQNEGVAPLLTTVKELVADVKALLARGRR